MPLAGDKWQVVRGDELGQPHKGDVVRMHAYMPYTCMGSDPHPPRYLLARVVTKLLHLSAEGSRVATRARGACQCGPHARKTLNYYLVPRMHRMHVHVYSER